MTTSDWQDGYPADTTYTYGYYPEFNPLRATLPLLNVGVTPQKRFEAACELGCGYGMSTNVQASATATSWYANDISPSHILSANSISSAVGNNAKFYNESFADFLHRKDLPDFDFIGVHGIYTWVSQENQKNIANFVKSKLKVGGILYISYNTNPGWSPFIPFVDLMKNYVKYQTKPGELFSKRVEQAFEFVSNFANTNPAVIKATPQLLDRIKKIKELDIRYLVHEFMTDHWKPVTFPEIHETLSQAMLKFVCTANILDHIEGLYATAEQSKILSNFADNIPMRELTKDFISNQQFRKEYWMRGENKLQSVENTETIRNLRVFLMVDPKDVTLQVSGVLGSVTLSEAIYKPILEYLGDNKIHTIRELEGALRSENINLSHLFQSAMILSGMGVLHLAQDAEDIAKCTAKAHKFNDLVLNKSASNVTDYNYLASPNSGGATPLGKFEQLFLLQYKQGRTTSQEMAVATWNHIQSQGQKLIRSGAIIESSEENLMEMNNLASNFQNKILPTLKSLDIIT